MVPSGLARKPPMLGPVPDTPSPPIQQSSGAEHEIAKGSIPGGWNDPPVCTAIGGPHHYNYVGTGRGGNYRPQGPTDSCCRARHLIGILGHREPVWHRRLAPSCSTVVGRHDPGQGRRASLGVHRCAHSDAGRPRAGNGADGDSSGLRSDPRPAPVRRHVDHSGTSQGAQTRADDSHAVIIGATAEVLELSMAWEGLSVPGLAAVMRGRSAGLVPEGHRRSTPSRSPKDTGYRW